MKEHLIKFDEMWWQTFESKEGEHLGALTAGLEG
jgi:hypothetical protein